MSPIADLPPVVHSAVHASLSPSLTASRQWEEYTVRSGDTLYDLAASHGTTVSVLTQRNGLSHGGRWIQAGATIEVPRHGASAQSGGSSSETSSSNASTSGSSASGSSAGGSGSGAGTTVTVRPGDTLSHIAVRHRVSVAAIVRANDLSSSRLIHPGQQLTIPGTNQNRSDAAASRSSTPSATPSTTPVQSSGTQVTVRAGDTLSHIAARHKVSVADLQRANPSVNARYLAIGATLTIPGTGGSSSSTTPAAPTPRSTPYSPDNIGDKHAGEQVSNTFLNYTYSSAVARSAEANRQYLQSVPVPSTAEVKEMIVSTSTAHGVDPKLMLALASMESGYQHRAVSPANAIGIMQVIPSSGTWASDLVGRELNLLDPQDNVTAGVVIMRALLRAADDERQAIGGYYQGLAGVRAHGMYSDTRHYVNSIQALRSQL